MGMRVLGMLMVAASWCSSVQAELTPVTRQMLDQEVIPAYQRGQSIRMVERLSVLVSRMNRTQVAELDTYLLMKNLPTSGTLLVKARVAAAHHGLTKELPRASALETLLILESIKLESDNQVTQSQDLIHKSDEIEHTFPAFEQALWDIHVTENEIRNAFSACEYAGVLQRAARRVNRKQLSEEQAALLDKDYQQEQLNLSNAARQLKEKKLELRVHRMNLACRKLQESSVLRERIFAAYYADLDGALLQAVYQTADPSNFVRDMLRETTAEEINEKLSQAREADAALVDKTRLFFTGLHWWLRGRYGQGPEGLGLLKSAAALQTPAGQFGLYMPVETPRPTDPMEFQSVPEVARRHHYIWMYEYRRITPQFARSDVSRTKGENRVKEVIKLRRFY